MRWLYVPIVHIAAACIFILFFARIYYVGWYCKNFMSSHANIFTVCCSVFSKYANYCINIQILIWALRKIRRVYNANSRIYAEKHSCCSVIHSLSSPQTFNNKQKWISEFRLFCYFLAILSETINICAKF